MGVKNFRKFIESKVDEPIKILLFDEASVKIKAICIDINIFIYKFVTAIRKTGKDLYLDGKITSHLVGLKNQINLFKKLGIDIVYVFDGQAPKEKTKILIDRNLFKEKAKRTYEETKSIQSYQQSFFITNEIIDDTIEFLKRHNIKYIYDETKEADAICASLVKNGIVDCVYSTDFDILVYGAKCLIIGIDYKKRYMEYISLNHILQELNITYDDFIDMIVISGCDYCGRRENMTLNKAYKMIQSGEKIKLTKAEKKAKDVFSNVK